MAQAVSNLAKRGAGDRRGTVNIIHQPGDVIENEREVRIELAFHGYGPRAECRCFDVYLIHDLDVGRMPAVESGRFNPSTRRDIKIGIRRWSQLRIDQFDQASDLEYRL